MSALSPAPSFAPCQCPMSPTQDNESPITLSTACGGSQFILFMGVLETFLRLQCDISDPCRQPPIDNRPLPATVSDATYDYIVVGAGTAGAIVASRLSEDPSRRVLLLEAGGDEPIGMRIPAFFRTYLKQPVNWLYATRPNGRSYLRFQPEYWVRGRVLGGTSVINGMIYIRGTREDFDGWARKGNPGWSWADVEPSFRRTERLQGIRIGRMPEDTPRVLDLKRAAVETGFGIHDLNGSNHTGAMNTHMSIDRGIRASTSRLYLHPAWDRRNLHIRVFTLATRVLIDAETKRAYGVETIDRRDGRRQRWFASREVIVCGGAIESPKLLMLSGIGHAAHLRQVGVPTTLVDLPGVGRNVQNHMGLRLKFVSQTERLTRLNRAMAADYLQTRRGPLHTNGETLIWRYRTPYARPEEGVDMEIVLADDFTNPENACSQSGAINRTAFVLHGYCFALHPYSRGRIRLVSLDPLQPPECFANELADERDVETILDGVQTMVRLADSEAMAKYRFRLQRQGGEACERFEWRSAAYWRCVIRQETYGYHHSSGTCKMGPRADRSAVVDHRLRVHGVRGLRVCDGSIMPDVVAGNTAATCMMIGEHGAKLILKDAQ